MKSFSFSSVGLIAMIVVVLITAPNAYAADTDYWGWNDYGTYDTWSDYGSYNTWNDYGAYDTWSDYGTYDTWSDYGTYDTWSDYGSYDTWYDAGAYSDSDWYNAGTSDWYDAGTSDWYNAGTSDWYNAGYSYDYGCGTSCGGSYYTPTYSTGCGSYCGGNYSTPRYPTYVPQVTIGQPGKSSSYVSNNTTTNTNITNIDNSIHDSFNDYSVTDSYNMYISTASPQHPVVSHPSPYCTINHAMSGGYGYYNSGNVAYLSWSSQNATSAYLSNVGNVAVSGAQNVYPSHTTTYTLTVYGINGQSATCSTTVNVNTYYPPTYTPPIYTPPTYVPPVQQPYVALTQIPYTGFDFGPVGNAMYWAGLITFALAGAYLMVYYRGGMFALAGSMIGVRTQQAYAPVVPAKAPLLVEREAAEAAKMAPVVASIRKSGTTDTMAIVASKDGSMPKIVINRG